MDLQIAFQGGGARLALLIPIVEALRELEGENKEELQEINVTRVAGTSAGAIAAALLAGKGNIPALVQHLRNICEDDGAVLKRIFPPFANVGYKGAFRIAKRLLWDKLPLGDELGLSKLLGDALQAAQIDRGILVSGLGRPCFLISVNLGEKDRSPAPGKTKLVQALIDSAGLPFIFRLNGDRLDGGLLDNLPIDALKTPQSPGSADGEIVAIAFDEPEYTAQPGNALALAAALLDTTMTFKTRASRDAVTPSHVHEVATKVGDISVASFEVQGFIDFINDQNAYNHVKREAKTWFRNFIKLKRELRTGSGSASRQIELDSRFEAFQANLRRVAEHNYRHPTLLVTETVFEVIAYGLVAPDDPEREPDVVRRIDKVKVGSQPLFLHAAVLYSVGGSTIVSRDYKVFDSNRRQVDFVAFDIPGESKNDTWHLTIFLNPLPSSAVRDEVYTIQQTYEVIDFMRPLHLAGVDYLGQGFVQAEVTDVAEIRLCVPKTVGPLVLLQGSPEQFATLNLPVDALAARQVNVVPGRELKKAVVESCPGQFDAYVWRAENCKRDEALRVVYRTVKPAPD